jgi:hypothetical protein
MGSSREVLRPRQFSPITEQANEQSEDGVTAANYGSKVGRNKCGL